MIAISDIQGCYTFPDEGFIVHTGDKFYIYKDIPCYYHFEIAKGKTEFLDNYSRKEISEEYFELLNKKYSEKNYV